MISIIVAVHELGHYIGAKTAKIGIEEFAIGFGPRIYQRKINSDTTIFSIRLFPLGGFVKPYANEKENQKDGEILFENGSTIQKLIMIASGPIFNFILAILLTFIAYTVVGNKELPPVIGEVAKESVFYKAGLRDGDEISQINNNNVKHSREAQTLINSGVINGDDLVFKLTNDKIVAVETTDIDLRKLGENFNKLTGLYFKGPIGEPIIAKTEKNEVGDRAGLLVGDRIVSVNNDNSGDYNRYLREIKNNPNKEIKIMVLRDEDKIEIELTPKKVKARGELIGKIGVEILEPEPEGLTIVRMDIVDGIKESVSYLFNTTKMTLVSLKKMVYGDISTDAISGPISIANYSGKSAEKGVFNFLILTSAISIGVGVFNLLPLPLLDGGQIIIYSIEGIRKKKIPVLFMNYIQALGVIVLLIIFSVAIINDINKVI